MTKKSICLGSIADLTLSNTSIDFVVNAMRDWSKRVSTHCTTCKHPMVATIADGSTPHRRAVQEAVLALDTCDDCFAKRKNV